MGNGTGQKENNVTSWFHKQKIGEGGAGKGKQEPVKIVWGGGEGRKKKNDTPPKQKKRIGSRTKSGAKRIKRGTVDRILQTQTAT